MKATSLISIVGAALLVGMLAAPSAHAGSGLNKNTRATTMYQSPAQPKAKPAVSKKKTEYQVAVMAKSPAQPTVRRSVFIHR